MVILAQLVLYAWLPIILYLFVRYSPQRAVIISFIAGWMFLPQMGISLPFIPDFDRINSTCYGVLVGILLFDPGRLNRFKLSWIDIPIVTWSLCNLASSLTNGLGLYDGVNQSLSTTMSWGVPYFIGRLYLDNFIALRRLAIAIFIGVVIYAPMCLYESRLMQNFHLLVYGFQHPSQTFIFSIRLGGYRPSIFMTSGLMLSLWMMLGTILAMIIWRSKLMSKLWGIPIVYYVGLLLITFVLIRSTGAYVLFATSVAILFIAKWFKIAPFFWSIVAITILYIYTGAAGNFPREQYINLMSNYFEPDRIESMDFRFKNEELLSAKARERAVFGWGGFGRSRIFNEKGEDISTTDSLWIIALGSNGAVGLASVFGVLLLPVISFGIRFPAKLWGNPLVAPTAAFAVFILMYAYDCTANAMVNPVYTLICGGIAGVAVNKNPLLDR